MKTGMTLDQLHGELIAQSISKVDYVANTNELGFNLIGVGVPKWAIDIPSHGYYVVTPYTHLQIASKMRVPRAYYERMMQEAPNLLQTNVRHWFDNTPHRRLIRTLGGNARAFLSDRYRRIDHDQVVLAALPAMMEHPNAVVMSSNVTEEKLYLKTIFRDMEAEVKPGDIVRPGIMITNSEIGTGAVNVQAFFYRDYCTSGCVFGSQNMFSYRRSHLGKTIEGVGYKVFSDETLKKDDEALMAQVRDVVAAASDQSFFTRMIDRLRETTDTKPMVNPEAGIEVLAKEYSLNDDERRQALFNIIEDRDYTQWGAINAVTKIANETESYDRASELESLGVKLINMSMAQWTKIASVEKVAA